MPVLLLALLLVCACGDDEDARDAAPSPALDAGVDAPASEPDAEPGPGPCGGHDRLEVRGTLSFDSAPASGAYVYVYCGETVLTQVLDRQGTTLFEGLDLGDHPVDVTMALWTIGLPPQTILGVDATSGGRLDVTLEGSSPGGQAAFFRGRVELSEPGAIAALWMPWTAAVIDASPYILLPELRELYRLTATEYRIEGDALVPISFVDLTFPPPPFEEGPTITFVPGGEFATATVDLTTDDERLAARWIPGLATPLEIRGPVLVSEYEGSDGIEWRRSNNLVGMTTLLESSETLDRAEVAWWPELRGAPLTQLQMADSTFRVWSAVRVAATPDTIGTFDMPDPPRIEGLMPGHRRDLSELELTLVRPEGLGADANARVDIVSDQPWGPALIWRIHLPAGSDQVRFPVIPEVPYDGLDPYGGTAAIRLEAIATDDRDPATGLNLYASDGRYFVDLQ